MKKINVQNLTKYSLELIFKESDKLASQVLKSLSENVNKSFVFGALYSSIFSFSFIKVVENELMYLYLLIGSIISTLVISKNMFPNVVNFNGALPENMIDEYFDSFQDEDLDKEYLATQIESYNTAINKNKSTIDLMVSRFKKSIWIMFLAFGFFGIIFTFFPFIKCFIA